MCDAKTLFRIKKQGIKMANFAIFLFFTPFLWYNLNCIGVYTKIYIFENKCLKTEMWRFYVFTAIEFNKF